MSDILTKIISKPGELGSVNLIINGPMNVSNVSALLTEMLAAYEQAESVTIDLSGVTEIDSAGLQLFCASHRSSIFSNKGFRITGQEQPVIGRAAEEMGCLRKSGCALDTQQTCIWTRESF